VALAERFETSFNPTIQKLLAKPAIYNDELAFEDITAAILTLTETENLAALH
jgi:hypothetical protein